MGREAMRIERTSRQRRLLPFELDQLMGLAGAVGKVVELQANPFSPAFMRRLQKASDEELEQAKGRLGAIETTATVGDQ